MSQGDVVARVPEHGCVGPVTMERIQWQLYGNAFKPSRSLDVNSQ